MNRLQVLTPENIQSGLHPALPEGTQPLWADGRNVIFREQGVRPEPGQTILFPKPSADKVVGLMEMRQDQKRIVVWGTHPKLYKWDSTTGVIITYTPTFTGIAAETPTQIFTRWSLASWGDWIIACNGVEQIKVDKNLNILGNLTGTPVTPFHPEILVKSGPYMLAFNHDDGQAGHVSCWWCSDNNIEDWVIAGDNTAGMLTLHDASSGIRAARGLGPIIMAYTDNTAHAVSFIGDPFFWGAVPALRGIGAVSKHSVTDGPGRAHFGFGPRGIWTTDGTTYEYIDVPSVRDYIWNNINRSQLSQVCCWHDMQRERIVWWYPSEGSLVLDRAIGFHYRGGLWHIPGHIRYSSADQAIFDYPLLGDANGSVYVAGLEDTLPAPPHAPLALVGKAKIDGITYGRGGYGMGGYGGTWRVDG